MVWWVVALRMTGLGWYVAACVVLGILGGLWLDNRVGTRAVFPVFTLVGTVLGSAAAFWGVYKMILPVLYGAKHGEMTRRERKG
jgi:F0F1-type ATP synthase assembly protein I